MGVIIDMYLYCGVPSPPQGDIEKHYTWWATHRVLHFRTCDRLWFARGCVFLIVVLARDTRAARRAVRCWGALCITDALGAVYDGLVFTGCIVDVIAVLADPTRGAGRTVGGGHTFDIASARATSCREGREGNNETV